MQTCNVTIRVYVLRSLCQSDYRKQKIQHLSKSKPSYCIISYRFAFFVGPSCVYFGSHFQIVLFLCRNRFPDTMLYMAAVAKAAATSKFDLSCRPLSAQRAFMANTRDARTNPMSRFVWSSVNCARSTFDDYRYIIPGTTFISSAINSIV